MRSEFHLIGFEIVKRLPRRHCDPLIIDRTKGLVLRPLTAPCTDLS